MRRLPILLAVLLAMLPATTVHAGNWGIGANLGFQVFQGPDVEDYNTVAWPSMNLLPGLRVSFAGWGPHEFYVDSHLNLASSSSNSSRDFIAQAGYMYVFPSSSNLSTYLTASAGAGFSAIDISDPVGGDINASAAGANFGGGIGIRHSMGNGHGTLRAEVRYDRFSKGEDKGFILLDEGDAFSVKLGFDLWDKER